MIPGEQPDLSALPPETSPVKRRLAAQHVRDARDRLTSTSGTRPHFDYELLRQYAQNRLSASLVILLLVATIGFLSSLWTDAVAAGAWTASVLVIHAVIITKCRQFLSQPMSAGSAKGWRLRFIMLDLFYGLAWMFILIHPVGTDESSNTFMLFVMLLVVAVSSMLASSLPIAAFAATFPVTAAIALDFALQGNLRSYILAIMAVSAQGYFAVLAYRLYSTTLATLEARAEKDALIGELEQAKMISDEARQRAEAANISKSRFLAQMSHELRTPLNAILGFSEIMQHEMFGPVGNARYRDYANDIHVSGAHLLSIINDILDLAKAEAGKQELQEDRMSVVETVTACVRLMGERATNAGVGLENNVPPDLPDLHADERKVKQVLLNLLSNAVKFTPPGGRIAVDARIDDDGTMQVEVSDTGIGMSVADIPKALAPFGQIDSRLARKYQGTGLGLPLVRALTDLHGATLNIVSAVGQGTTVVVTFPACRVLAAEGEEISRRVAG